MHIVITLVSFALWVTAIGLIANVASSRGRRPRPWMVAAFLIGWLAFIPLFIAPNLKKGGASQQANA